jgi:alpha-galactosidase
MKTKNNCIRIGLSFFCIAMICSSCNKQTTKIDHGKLRVEINYLMQTRVSSTEQGARPLMSDFQNSEYLVTKHHVIQNFKLSDNKKTTFEDKIGKGTYWEFKGKSVGYPENISKILNVAVYDSFPDWAFCQVKYINAGLEDVIVNKWINNAYSVNSQQDTPDFWSFQGSSTSQRADWILPVKPNFYKKNFLGMNNTDYGGGIPVIDLWRKDEGIAIGHTEMVPKLVSLPIDMEKKSTSASMCVEYEFTRADTLHPGDTLLTFGTFVSIHRGDYFHTLRQYSLFMQKKGIVMPESEPAAFEPIWCAWGYMRNFTIQEVLGTLPKVKELGFKWVGIDDGFQQAEGDWDVNSRTFPGGDAQMRSLVDKIHAYGLKAQIWWAPLAVDPQSKLFAKNPDIIIRSADEAPEYITWWNSYYMSPVYKKTLDHTKSMVEKFMGDWNYDGLKLDGQHQNACLPDYNWKHDLSNPEEAPEGVPAFFKLIYQTARQIKPHSIIEICPCGDVMSFYNIPYTNQFVASDPEGSKQIRSKAKTYKAIAPKTAYFGDHVELSDSASDFASTIGVGGVPGSKFTWPKDSPLAREGPFVLTPKNEASWKKWINLYNLKMLSTGTYLGELYDIGYDKPETHVIQKADTLYYAFYAKNWTGMIQLKGLTRGKYRVLDYVNNKDYGVIQADKPEIDASFDKFLMIVAYPENK